MILINVLIVKQYRSTVVRAITNSQQAKRVDHCDCDYIFGGFGRHRHPMTCLANHFSVCSTCFQSLKVFVAVRKCCWLTWSSGCVLNSFPLSSPIVCRQERERVPEHLFWMRVENFFGVVCACADSDLFTGLQRMPLISPHFHWFTVSSLRFDW
ncbi:hypothetical protein AVEN_27566-1 [Araneus ventricosus]|uniref:Uncharacterized protein n=1 Tax=Araneus ventricosus TaxID=182803 RepID=A0A4Y2SAW8_ARAVE|nr:hypothetical protein AVEN_13947-1 [Araneus ventricosus]GBN85384.1 hypothetical protein AVEN_27566-1 [Araneus ventricosus]